MRPAEKVNKALRYIPLYAWLIFLIVIFGYVVLASLSTTREIFTNNLLSSGFHFENYTKVFKDTNILLYFTNSALYTAAACLGVIVITAPAAYIMGRIELKGKKLLELMFISALSIPGLLISIPLFKMFISLQLTGSIFTLIIVYICVHVPFGVFFLIGFFASIPKELEESAVIDGCGPIKAFIKVIMPVASPGIITLTIFNIMGIWNEYFYALIFASNPDRQPVALALQSIVVGYTNTGNYSGIFAASLLVFLPTFIVYVFVSRKIVAWITMGAVKG